MLLAFAEMIARFTAPRPEKKPIIGAANTPTSIVKTDGLPAYLGAPEVTHEAYVVGTMGDHVILPGIHLSLLQPQDLGARPLSRFRFNRRHTRHASFASLLRIAVTIKPRTYEQIVQLGSTG